MRRSCLVIATAIVMLGFGSPLRAQDEAAQDTATSHPVASQPNTPDEGPAFDKALAVFLVPGPLMVLVALTAVLIWRRRSGAAWRWFWVGAAVWLVAVVIKFTWAYFLNAPILRLLDKCLSQHAYVLAGGAYIGLQSSVCEMGLTLAAALIWRQMTRDAPRGVAVGVGAGAFEAALLGIGSFIGIAAALSGKVPGAEQLAQVARMTPLVWLAGPVERVIAILCHTATRSLILLGVARRRWSLFWWGFLIFAGLDGVAGLYHMGAFPAGASMWWVELSVLPFGLVSVPLILWCVRHWPGSEPAIERAGDDVIAE